MERVRVKFSLLLTLDTHPLNALTLIAVVATPVDIVPAAAHIVALVLVVGLSAAGRLPDKWRVTLVQVVGSPAHMADKWVSVVAGRLVDSKAGGY